MSHERILRLESVTAAGPQLHLRLRVGDLAFTTTYWYGDLDLGDFAERFGAAFADRLFFHIAAFEMNKLASLAPDAVDFGDWSHHATEPFRALWQEVFEKVWAQWRYENDRPEARELRILGAHDDGRESHEPGSHKPIRHDIGATEILSFCGGGKDSLVSMKLLERAGIPFSSFAYSHSVYGRHEPQHRLIDALLDRGTPQTRHKLWAFDDFLDAPVLELCPQLGVRTVTAAETPSSIFASLPIVLAHGYRHVCLGHERSANRGNLLWERTGEEVNHQWGKSFAAEELLNGYVQEHLVAEFSYFSLLQPIHDAAIFHLLRRDLDSVPFTHSCNLEKPWCKRCAKCAYVWINYMAYLPREDVDEVFAGTNLLDLPENHLSFRQMLGLESHTPFECIGHVEEARLAFALAHRKGLQGAAMDAFLADVPPFEVEPLLARYLEVHGEGTGLPSAVAAKVLPLMEVSDQDRASSPGIKSPG